MHRAASILVALTLALGACTGETPSNTSDGGQTRPGAGPGEGPDQRAAREAPDFSFETFDGDTFSLAEQRGTPVVLNFWESW